MQGSLAANGLRAGWGVNSPLHDARAAVREARKGVASLLASSLRDKQRHGRAPECCIQIKSYQAGEGHAACRRSRSRLAAAGMEAGAAAAPSTSRLSSQQAERMQGGAPTPAGLMYDTYVLLIARRRIRAPAVQVQRSVLGGGRRRRRWQRTVHGHRAICLMCSVPGT